MNWKRFSLLTLGCSLAFCIILFNVGMIRAADSKIFPATPFDPDGIQTFSRGNLQAPFNRIIVSSRQALVTSADYTSALLKGSNHLVRLQSDITEDNAGNGSPDIDLEDGGWDWQIDSTITSHSGSLSPENTYGATAGGLLGAYNILGGKAYPPSLSTLTSLEDTYSGTLANSNIDSGGDFPFLVRLSVKTGDSKYANLASARYDAKISFYGGSKALADAIVNSRGVNGDGIIPWDINFFAVGAAKLNEYFPGQGYDADADTFAQVIYEDIYNNNPGYFDETNRSEWWWTSGIAAALEAFTVSGTHLTERDQLAVTLLGYQNDGVIKSPKGAWDWNDDYTGGDYQTTAYAVMALMAYGGAQAKSACIEGVNWLVGDQRANGGWYWDGWYEYPEEEGEVLWAISLLVPDEVWVDDDYNSSTPGWGYDRFDKIQDGVNAVATAGRVNVLPGSYAEGVDVNKFCTLQSTGGPTVTTIDGTGTTRLTTLNYSCAVNFAMPGAVGTVILDGFTIKGTTSGQIGVLVNGRADLVGLNGPQGISSSFEIKNCVFDGLAFDGAAIVTEQINLDSGCSGSINDNEIKNSGAGIRISNSNNCTVAKNYVHDNKNYGVFVTKNKALAGIGAPQRTCENNLVRGNWIINNGGLAPAAQAYGALFGRDPGSPGDPPLGRNNGFINNLVTDNDYLGLYVHLQNTDAGSMSVTGNTFLRNAKYVTTHPTGGIYIAGSVNVTVYDNILMCHSAGNARDDGSTNFWDNGIDKGNFWDDWASNSGFPTQYNVTGTAGSIDHFPQAPSVVWVDDDWAGTPCADSVGGHLFGYDAFKKIQDGLNAVASGGTVHVLTGTYDENLLISKPLSLLGAGRDSVLVYPAISDIGQPNPQDPPSFKGSQMCVVQAQNVTIEDISFNGDSPTLTPPGTLDARNGIITNYNLGDYSNLKVQNCTVKNVYMRGIYAAAKNPNSLTGVDFNYNNVSNAKGISMQSAGVMLWGSSGNVKHNHVSDASLGIFYHWYSDGNMDSNTVTGCELGLGVNSNDVSTSISYNSVASSDQGIQTVYILAPANVTFNSLYACSVGVMLYGGGTGQNNIWDNVITGLGYPSSGGMWTSTDPYGAVLGNLKRNTIKGNVYGVILSEPSSNPSKSVSVLIGGDLASRNFIYDNLGWQLLMDYCNNDQNATYNYWGKSTYAQIEEEVFHKVDQSYLGLVDFDPAILHGDVNLDGQISVADIVYLINYLFKGGPAPELALVADINRDGSLTVSDVVYLINYLFKGGPAPRVIISSSGEASISKIPNDKPKLARPSDLHSVEK